MIKQKLVKKTCRCRSFAAGVTESVREDVSWRKRREEVVYRDVTGLRGLLFISLRERKKGPLRFQIFSMFQLHIQINERDIFGPKIENETREKQIDTHKASSVAGGITHRQKQMLQCHSDAEF